MDVMYWRFPHLDGEWSVKAGEPGVLVSELLCGNSNLKVQWLNGVPFDGTIAGIKYVYPKAPQESAWDTQVGGNHYTKMKIQPMQFSMANGLDPMQHTIIKYVSRFRDKNGIEDLEKARQTIDLLIAYEKEKKNATN